MGKAAEDEDDDRPVEPLHGGASATMTTDLADLLLDLVTSTTRVGVLLAEADEETYRLVGGRLEAFLGVVENLPTDPAPRRKLGFQTKKGRKK